ncbi:SPP1 Gp6-like portal protein [Brevibacterium sanguinis]|uniref:SPP1 Gp6-like portal protein n=2 Tax=Brevibacterium TaxID=1696 RepID=A0A366IKX5_9MICO|nr:MULTISPECIES: phage portal protein [Brevibacterium]RBP64143.1 SPP1 Gp6-like portal protein [Brevibacterium sanguinis]RBP71565.1 SPP1 Gp6-like portal protein [Brevibacterium celere]
MPTKNELTEILQKIDEPAAEYTRLTRYYEGKQPLTFLSPEARENLGNRLSSVSVNVPRLVVETIAERLRVTGFTRPDVWSAWLSNDMDTLSSVVHREALLLGDSYVIVWADTQGRPLVSVESATQVAVTTDPATRQVTSAVKRWSTKDGARAVWYGPDEIVHYVSRTTGATTTGFEPVEALPNSLGRPPVVAFRNGGRLLTRGVSEMLDVLALTDAAVKLTTDLLTASEYSARPRRWATGIELDEIEAEDGTKEVVNPYGESDRMMISEAADAKFGQLAGADLIGYENAIGVIMREISAVSGLPDHMLGLSGSNPTSADSIRASEATLTAKAEAKQGIFGRSWKQVAQLITAVQTGVDPATVEIGVTWADPSTRSAAQEADAVTKLVQAGVLPAAVALERLGYNADEISRIEAAKDREAARGAIADVQARADLAQILESRGMNKPASLAAAGLFAAANETRQGEAS